MAAALIALVAQPAPGRGPVPVGVGKSVVGVLAAYDPGSRAMTVRSESRLVVIGVPAKASVQQGPKHLRAEALRDHIGARVKVRYLETSKGRVAESVMISTSET